MKMKGNARQPALEPSYIGHKKAQSLFVYLQSTVTIFSGEYGYSRMFSSFKNLQNFLMACQTLCLDFVKHLVSAVGIFDRFQSLHYSTDQILKKKKKNPLNGCDKLKSL